MKDQISALVDGELDEAEAARLIARIQAEPDLRRVWDEYHRVGDSLRGHHSRDICAAVSEKLAAEPTVLAPRRTLVGRRMSQLAGAIATAAAVAVVTWVAFPGLFSEPQQAQVAQPQQAQPIAPVAAQAPEQVPAQVTEVDNYLLAHQRYSPANAIQGFAPYARTVSGSAERR
jgi:sigma-E factor negative regulatory protein RseA